MTIDLTPMFLKKKNGEVLNFNRRSGRLGRTARSAFPLWAVEGASRVPCGGATTFAGGLVGTRCRTFPEVLLFCVTCCSCSLLFLF
jgi:hypothetical protein